MKRATKKKSKKESKKHTISNSGMLVRNRTIKANEGKKKLLKERNKTRKARQNAMTKKRENESVDDKLNRYMFEVETIENDDDHPIEKIDKFYNFLVALYYRLQKFPTLQTTLEVQIDATQLAVKLGDSIKEVFNSLENKPGIDVDDLIAMMEGLGVNNAAGGHAAGAGGVNMTKYTKKINTILNSDNTSPRKIAKLYKLLSDFDDNLIDSKHAKLRDDLAIFLNPLVSDFATSIRAIIHGLGKETDNPNVKVDELSLQLGKLGFGF